ncbi:hypothetical protein [Rhodanobacter sp. T12-5]|uniref:hypothetical protein n=1 Tax=Rhodanobacter sp. T12-5 TaxID=2024611 RepID=UPI001562953E|nr:hypothetical protein [Rhodanobacter sp. T12-5]
MNVNLCVVGVWMSLAVSGIALAEEPACRIDHLNTVPVDRVKQDFVKNFCAHSKNCSARWKNFSWLLDKVLNDAEVPNVGTAAYLLATAVGETAVIDFTPGHEIQGHANADSDYMKPIGGTIYKGRGWVQLTGYYRYDKIGKMLGIDLLHNADLATKPEIAYTILAKGMIKGWFEPYRTDAAGGVTKPETPILISDFITDTEVDYDRSRAVINANCRKAVRKRSQCAIPDTPFKTGLYIPKASELNRAKEIGGYARQLERMLCDASRGTRAI